MREVLKKHYRFILFIILLLVWSVLLLYITPSEVVEMIGVEWGYALIFATALVGISLFTSASFYATVFALASTGEFNPILMGLTAAPALAFGDSVFFFFGRNGRSLVQGERLERFTTWVCKRPNWVIPVFAYVYTGMTPLPQDILMTALGLSGARFRYVLPAILLGNATFVTVISFLIMQGYSLVGLV